MTKIAIRDLRVVIEKLLVNLEQSGMSEIELKKDFYWAMPSDSQYNPYEDPKDLTLGQLTDDWSELVGILNGTKEPVSYGLVWAAAILKYLGENAET